jgi:tRNA(fMet)-specific endonuclease VapC
VIRYALDTNIVSFLMRRNPLVEARLLAQPPDAIHLPAIVLAELSFGKHKNPARTQALEIAIRHLRDCYATLNFDDSAAEWYGMIRARALQQPIGDRDLLVAATCLARGCTLVTNNMREFGRIPELRCEDWSLPA